MPPPDHAAAGAAVAAVGLGIAQEERRRAAVERLPAQMHARLPQHRAVGAVGAVGAPTQV